MIDVTDIEDAAIGDVATIYGTDGSQRLPAIWWHAAWELLTSIFSAP